MYQLFERGGSASCTLAVSTMEEVVAHVERFGIDASQRSSGARAKTLMIVDPDGNHIAFANDIHEGEKVDARAFKALVKSLERV